MLKQGIYSSQTAEWRKLRDAGVLQGKKAGEKIGRLTPEQAEIARLHRQLDVTERRLATMGLALEIMSNRDFLILALHQTANLI